MIPRPLPWRWVAVVALLVVIWAAYGAPPLGQLIWAVWRAATVR